MALLTALATLPRSSRLSLDLKTAEWSFWFAQQVRVGLKIWGWSAKVQSAAKIFVDSNPQRNTQLTY
jgi:hypothetical protein